MTKKEQAQLEALQNELRLAKALRFTEAVQPDMPAPRYGDGGPQFITGFLFVAYSGFGGDTANPACSDSVNHNSRGSERTSTQGSRSLYSTRLLALRALRHVVEKEVAARLAAIDLQIEREQAAALPSPK